MKKPSDKKVSELKKKLEKFLPIIKKSLKDKINEADTRIILNDILSDVLGYDKYFEISAEQMTGAGYADYSIKLKGNKYFIIEAKAVDTTLKPTHMRQAVSYAAREGIPWVILTNANDWEIYKLIISDKVDVDLLFKFSILDMRERDYENLYYITKEAVASGLLDEYWEYKKAVNPATFLKVMLSDSVIRAIRKQLRQESGYKVSDEEIVDILITKIIRPEFVKKSTSISKPKDKEETKINLKNLPKNVKEVLIILCKAGKPLTIDEIKNELANSGATFQSLAPIMTAVSKRLKNYLIRKDNTYCIDKEIKDKIASSLGLH